MRTGREWELIAMIGWEVGVGREGEARRSTRMSSGEAEALWDILGPPSKLFRVSSVRPKRRTSAPWPSSQRSWGVKGVEVVLGGFSATNF